MSKSIFKNTIYKFTLSVFNIIVPVLVGPYINNLLDKSEFRNYNAATSILSFFLIFASFGIYNYGVREISKVKDDRQKLESLFSNLFLFGVITNIATTAVYILYIMVAVEPSSQLIFGVMAIQILGNTFMVEWVNEAVESFGFITRKTIFVRVISTILLFIVVTKPEHTLNYALLMSVTNAFNYLASFAYVKKKLRFNFSDIHLGRYVKPLLQVLFIANVNVLFTLLDRIMLAQFSPDPLAISVYTLPSNVINMIVLTMSAMITVSIPRLNYYVSQGQTDNYTALLDKSSRSFFMMIYPTCIGLFCLSYEAMYFYALPYVDASTLVLQIFSLRFAYTCVISIYSNQILYIFHKENALALMMLLGGGLNLIFNLLLLVFGVLTPAYAILTTTAAEVIMLYVMRSYIKRKLNLKFDVFSFKNMKYLYVSLPFIPIVYGIKLFKLGVLWTSVFSILACVAFYLLILFITKDKLFLDFAKRITDKLVKKKAE